MSETNNKKEDISLLQAWQKKIELANTNNIFCHSISFFVSEICLILLPSGIVLWFLTLIKPILGIEIYNNLLLIDENFNQESSALGKFNERYLD
ncbi:MULTISPECIES: hypothetical protein [Okeania]|nr:MULTISPECIES: hypothetical protein [Okeania]NET13173.1 hypothetical protein [Okeania sp. SIO1H6]NES77106.1 hypothetical protein [Okeania sp. SIO1H4]NET21423.1 hypothetical protein [Okeania sp. SIO1H5]NET77251.1 hypothetical protein [Okeania sp. SIO1F9]NET93913.1 hypothetical protein [Okeania sp. SIO1H2]